MLFDPKQEDRFDLALSFAPASGCRLVCGLKGVNNDEATASLSA